MPEQEQPIEQVLSKLMQSIGAILAEALSDHTKATGEKYGFALLMFGMTDKESNRMNYISNANREDMIAAMREFIARAEGRYFDAREKTFDFTKKDTKKQ